MRNDAHVAVIMPARNEAGSIGIVLSEIPGWVDQVIVCDNGSTDGTADVARQFGAEVVRESRRGYGSACQTALTALRPDVDVVVFLDADHSDHPDEMGSLVDPIVQGDADLVIGSRVRGQRERGALLLQARFGNWLACLLIRWLWGASFTDLGPFRAIRNSCLNQLKMRDPDYGWTVEMQVKAAALGLRVTEVPVSYRVRIGKSKISGTLRGVIGAGTKIIYTIMRHALQPINEQSMEPARNHLIVLARYPKPGTAKTRMIPALGEAGAAALSRDLTRHTLGWVRTLTRDDALSVEVRSTGGSEALMRREFGHGLPFRDQGDGDLGDRLERAAEEAFAGGAERVVLIGTDCPELGADAVREAFDQLRHSDLAIGPAEDGGYYLIGLSAPHREVFRGLTWGGASVLHDTLARARESRLSIAQLPMLRDVDRPDDLAVWDAVRTCSR